MMFHYTLNWIELNGIEWHGIASNGMEHNQINMYKSLYNLMSGACALVSASASGGSFTTATITDLPKGDWRGELSSTSTGTAKQ